MCVCVCSKVNYERDALLEITYAVLKMAGWTLYSLAKTKGTIPCGRAACHMQNHTHIYYLPLK